MCDERSLFVGFVMMVNVEGPLAENVFQNSGRTLIGIFCEMIVC